MTAKCMIHPRSYICIARFNDWGHLLVTLLSPSPFIWTEVNIFHNQEVPHSIEVPPLLLSLKSTLITCSRIQSIIFTHYAMSFHGFYQLRALRDLSSNGLVVTRHRCRLGTGEMQNLLVSFSPVHHHDQ